MICTIVHKLSFETDLDELLASLAPDEFNDVPYEGYTEVQNIITAYERVSNDLAPYKVDSFPVVNEGDESLPDDKVTLIKYYNIANLEEMNLIVEFNNAVEKFVASNNGTPINCITNFMASQVTTSITCDNRFFIKVLNNKDLLNILTQNLANLFDQFKFKQVFDTAESGTHLCSYGELDDEIIITVKNKKYTMKFNHPETETEVCKMFDTLSQLLNYNWRKKC